MRNTKEEVKIFNEAFNKRKLELKKEIHKCERDNKKDGLIGLWIYLFSIGIGIIVALFWLVEQAAAIMFITTIIVWLGLKQDYYEDGKQ